MLLEVLQCPVLICADQKEEVLDIFVGGKETHRRPLALELILNYLFHVHEDNPESEPQGEIPVPGHDGKFHDAQHIGMLNWKYGSEYRFPPADMVEELPVEAFLQQLPDSMRRPGVNIKLIIGKVDMSKKNEITYGDNAKNNSLNLGPNITSTTARKIDNSFNRAAEIEKQDSEVGVLLQELSQQVNELAEELSTSNTLEKAEQVADDLETLTKELAREKPRRRWWEMSTEGLCEAGENIGQVGEKVIATAKKLAALLLKRSSGD